MWSLFAAAAGRTSKIRLGPEVTKVVLKDPTIIAQQATTLDELTGGRAELVFSTGNFALLQQYGVDLRGTKPISRLREAHHVLNTFLADGAIDFDGDYYSYSGLFTAARPVQKPLPIKLGGMRGPRSFELAGEIADGLRTRRSPTRARHSTSRLTHSVAEPSGPAATGRRPELLERNSVDPAEVASAAEAFTQSDVRRALELTPASVGETLSVAGTARAWIDKIERDLIPAGFRHLLVTFVDPFLVESWAGISIDGLPTLEEQLRLFEREVMAPLAASRLG